jgi:hypothetical protein
MFLDPDQAASGVFDVLCFDTVKTMGWLASDLHGFVFQYYHFAGLVEISNYPWLCSWHLPLGRALPPND